MAWAAQEQGTAVRINIVVVIRVREGPKVPP